MDATFKDQGVARQWWEVLEAANVRRVVTLNLTNVNNVSRRFHPTIS